MENKTIGYCRVSSTEQAEEGFSIENQTARIKAYCEFSNLTNITFLNDKGISGKRQANREGFQQMLDLVKTKQVSNIVVYSISRLGRNTIETLQFIDEMNKRGIAVHSISEKLDTSSAMGKFFLTILSALCELESGQLGERVSSVLQHKKSNKQVYCRQITGFDKVEGSLSPNKYMQTIKAIFNMKQVGKTTYQIAQALREQEIKTPQGKDYQYSSIQKILKNPIYAETTNC